MVALRTPRNHGTSIALGTTITGFSVKLRAIPGQVLGGDGDAVALPERPELLCALSLERVERLAVVPSHVDLMVRIRARQDVVVEIIDDDAPAARIASNQPAAR